jgi:hypothetical protein
MEKRPRRGPSKGNAEMRRGRSRLPKFTTQRSPVAPAGPGSGATSVARYKRLWRGAISQDIRNVRLFQDSAFAIVLWAQPFERALLSR